MSVLYFVIQELFCNAKAINGLLLIALSRIQHNTGEVGAVRRIGEMLGLQTYCRATGEGSAVGTLVSTGEVCCIELHSGLSGVAFQSTSTLRLCNAGSKAELALFFLVQHVVVVKALSDLNLLVVCINVLAEILRSPEVKRCTFDL